MRTGRWESRHLRAAGPPTARSWREDTAGPGGTAANGQAISYETGLRVRDPRWVRGQVASTECEFALSAKSKNVGHIHRGFDSSKGSQAGDITLSVGRARSAA